MAELAMRESYGRALADYGAEHPQVVALDVDTSASTLSSFFAQRFPERFFNIGIAEPCMVDVAAGLALGGFIPFINGFASILTLRALEQIRSCVCIARTSRSPPATPGSQTSRTAPRTIPSPTWPTCGPCPA
jgi:transketolase